MSRQSQNYDPTVSQPLYESFTFALYDTLVGLGDDQERTEKLRTDANFDGATSFERKPGQVNSKKGH